METVKVAIGLDEYHKKHGIKATRILTRLDRLIQIPVRLYLFIAVAKLCNIEQLTHSGFSLLPDLTIVDSTYVLPVLLAALVDSRLRVNTRSSCQSNPMPR